MTSVFIAGSRRLGKLNDSVKSRIDNLISNDYLILVGDANGADKAVQNYLKENHYQNVIVYCSGNTCRNNLGHWKSENVPVDRSLKGRAFYTVKDKKMAEDADYGLMIWDGKSPGTLNNVVELLRNNKKSLIYLSPKKTFFQIGKHQQIFDLLEDCSPIDRKTIQSKVDLSFGSRSPVQEKLSL